MDNPLKDIEDQKTWIDFGRQSHMIYKGAMEDGADHLLAIQLVRAYFAGMYEAVVRNPKEDEDA